MLPNDPDPVQPHPNWPVLSEPAAEPSAPTSYSYLLDVDADLADEFDLRMRVVARQVATIRVFDASVGEFDALPWFDDGGLGLLVLDGMIVANVCVGGRTAAELVGTGDLIQPQDAGADHLLPRDVSWRALEPLRIGVLDRAFADRVRPWPQIVQALLRRAGRRTADLSVQRAIAAQPRLEVRLSLLLWHLAARWGRVDPSGIRLSLPLTHALLGRLVGAERPSVSHALGRLSAAGLVTGAAGDLHLTGTADEHLATLVGLESEPVAAAQGARA